MLRSLESYQGDISTLKALTLQPYVFLRSKELAGLCWDEIDLDQKAIEISAERMKKKRPHLVPITPQVLEVIEYMQPISGDCNYVFLSARTKQRLRQSKTGLKCHSVTRYKTVLNAPYLAWVKTRFFSV
ncbi:tyrosine-type recombinase/integrase [Thiomicrospira microaerophila]|uniref:tyrosine-type recombinase/integrase n=1 Tax=Thiomicrospira microaerophila TaxID=406020 RepID=UPI00200FFD6A|nr:tyrosine-type recombinase/integrase [Thiomicrospira microaerophila]UQB43229.1 tyrosine-type recombinase/integrase [Thiomicrospira microaerophila]